MRFKVTKASDWEYEGEVEINTLEELGKFISECESKIIIYTDFKEITIYDDYIE